MLNYVRRNYNWNNLSHDNHLNYANKRKKRSQIIKNYQFKLHGLMKEIWDRKLSIF